MFRLTENGWGIQLGFGYDTGLSGLIIYLIRQILWNGIGRVNIVVDTNEAGIRSFPSSTCILGRESHGQNGSYRL